MLQHLSLFGTLRKTSRRSRWAHSLKDQLWSKPMLIFGVTFSDGAPCLSPPKTSPWFLVAWSRRIPQLPLQSVRREGTFQTDQSHLWTNTWLYILVTLRLLSSNFSISLMIIKMVNPIKALEKNVSQDHRDIANDTNFQTFELFPKNNFTVYSINYS